MIWLKGEVEQGQMVHRLSCLGEISIRIQNHRELENQDCPQILVWGTNISLDVRTLRNSETVPELVREEVQRSFVCTEPTSTASSPAVAKVLSAGWDRDIYWNGCEEETKHAWTDNNDFLLPLYGAAEVHLKNSGWNAIKLPANKLSLPLFSLCCVRL